MNRVQALYDSLSPRDAVLLATSPTLMMPRFGTLPAIGIGERRFIAGQDGWYLEARTPAVRACVLVAESPRALPYGPVTPYVELTGGLLPMSLYAQFAAAACARSPSEWACGVVYDPAQQQYRTVIPEVVSASAGHISYRSPESWSDNLVLDIHSHGEGKAFFSATDDASDCHGVYIATVLGKCRSVRTVESVSRLVIDGYTFALDWQPFAS